MLKIVSFTNILLVFSLLNSGCCTWGGYVQDLEFETISSPPENPGVSVSFAMVQPSKKQRIALKEALQKTLAIISDPEFVQAVHSYDSWIRSVGDQTPITGAAVYESILAADYSGLQLLAHKPSNAIAVTNIRPMGKHHGIVISPSQIAKWGNKPKDKAELINTIAHELTHVVKSTSEEMRYLDEGHKPKTEDSLVSYRIGNTAECVYLKQAGLTPDVAECIAKCNIVEGTSCLGPTVE